MATAVLYPIPDSERFIELAETPPLLLPADLPPTPTIPTSTSIPLRPRRSSQRGLQIFTPATNVNHDASRNHSIIDLYSSRGEEGDNDATPAEELFYSPLSSPALVGTIHQSPAQRNRTSEIPVLPASYNHANANGKEAGVKRAFRSKVGTDGSISLSILPSAAALSEMLELDGSGGSATSEILSTYQPASTFSRSNPSLNGGSTDNLRRGSAHSHGNGRGASSDIRRGSAVSTTGSVNTRPLAIKRKKPAVYHPEYAALPVSRTASLDACTPTSEVPPLPAFNTTVATPQSSPIRNKSSELALPVTQTFQTPLRRIPQSDITPPATPPPWTGSTHSDTYTEEEESVPISPRSSRDRKENTQAPSATVPSAVNARKLEYGIDDAEEAAQNRDVPPERPRRATDDHVDLASLTPMSCSIEEMQDRPGMLRRDSDDESDDLDYDDEEGSDHDFGLESFPVPSVIFSSPRERYTPRMFPVSPNPAGSIMGEFNRDITASPAQRKVSNASDNSRRSPKTDLYPIPTDADGNQEWDQATELEIRDRVFRAEIKKPNKTDKARRKALQKVFDQLKKPTKLELYEASLYSVRDENGHKIRFGTLFEEKKTIVCFIRHFWCSQCQNYVDAIAKVRPEVLAKHNMKLVIVSNGSWKMIKSYRKLLGNKCPYPIYTDRSKHIYTTLGMTLRSWDAGKGPEVGNYIQNSLGGSIVAGIKSGVKLPLKPPGDQQQLGGEFILGPGFNCHFTHRMKTTRGHAEIEEVLASAGINLEEENRLFGIREGSETPNGHLDHNSYYSKKDKDRKRASAVHYSSANGIGSSSNLLHQDSPSLASSILNRLSSPKTTNPSSSKRFSLHGASSTTSATSPPESPYASTARFSLSGAGVSNGDDETSPPTSPTSPTGSHTRKKSNRLVKKNRNSLATSPTATSPLSGLFSTAPSTTTPLQGVPASQSSNDLRMSRSRFSYSGSKKDKRLSLNGLSSSSSASTSTLIPESKSFPSLSPNYNASSPNVNAIQEEEATNEEEDEEAKIRESALNKARKHSSAPPVIPTPTTVTPSSMGFLQVPSASRSSSSLRSPPSEKAQAQQPSFFYSSIPNTSAGDMTKKNANERMSSDDSITKVKPLLDSSLRRKSISHPELKHRYSATSPQSYTTTRSGEKTDYLRVIHDEDHGIHSEEIRPTSSRFSESSGDEDVSKIKKRSSNGTSASTLSRPRSLVRSLTLRSSNSSLKSSSNAVRPTIVRVD